MIRPPDPRVPEAEAEPGASQMPHEHRLYAPPPGVGEPPSYELPPELRSDGVRVSQEPSIKKTSGVRDPRAGVANPFGGRTTSLRAQSETPSQSGKDPIVASLTLDRRLTGGWNADERRGDEGVAVVVELRNAENEIVNIPAAVSVVVIDPSRPMEQSRVARWDLKPNQVMNTFRKSFLGYGSHLELPWSALPPRSRQLQLHVRATTPDGRVFRAERAIQVDLLPGVVESLAEPLAVPVRGSEVCEPCDLFDAGFCPTP